jgi:hypothetical protein
MAPGEIPGGAVSLPDAVDKKMIKNAPYTATGLIYALRNPKSILGQYFTLNKTDDGRNYITGVNGKKFDEAIAVFNKEHPDGYVRTWRAHEAHKTAGARSVPAIRGRQDIVLTPEMIRKGPLDEKGRLVLKYDDGRVEAYVHVDVIELVTEAVDNFMDNLSSGLKKKPTRAKV